MSEALIIGLYWQRNSPLHVSIMKFLMEIISHFSKGFLSFSLHNQFEITCVWRLWIGVYIRKNQSSRSLQNNGDLHIVPIISEVGSNYLDRSYKVIAISTLFFEIGLHLFLVQSIMAKFQKIFVRLILWSVQYICNIPDF